jgi:hypothetical protein
MRPIQQQCATTLKTRAARARSYDAESQGTGPALRVPLSSHPLQNPGCAPLNAWLALFSSPVLQSSLLGSWESQGCKGPKSGFRAVPCRRLGLLVCPLVLCIFELSRAAAKHTPHQPSPVSYFQSRVRVSVHVYVWVTIFKPWHFYSANLGTWIHGMSPRPHAVLTVLITYVR